MLWSEQTVIPRLLLGTKGVKLLQHSMPREIHFPVTFHIDAFTGESATQLWCLNPPNFPFYPKGASTPEICSGFIGHENRLALFCHTIGRRICQSFGFFFIPVRQLIARLKDFQLPDQYKKNAHLDGLTFYQVVPVQNFFCR